MLFPCLSFYWLLFLGITVHLTWVYIPETMQMDRLQVNLIIHVYKVIILVRILNDVCYSNMHKMPRFWFIRRMCKVSSKYLLSIDTFCSVQWYCYRMAKALIRLHGCADWFGPSLSASAWRHVFTWHSLVYSDWNLRCSFGAWLGWCLLGFFLHQIFFAQIIFRTYNIYKQS